uniref:Uncharacterized protein n=1 Tax=Anguilla anguilla TaxID=7936 RepID=A0A0E9UJN9_ANGAN
MSNIIRKGPMWAISHMTAFNQTICNDTQNTAVFLIHRK